MLAALLLALGEMEQETRGERQRAGIEAITANPALRRRKFRGRKKGATKGGIRANKPGRVVALREKGLTFPEIATALGVGLSTAKRYVYEHVREEGASSPG